MDEMSQDLRIPEFLKNAGRPFRSVEAFHNRWRAREWCVSKSATVVVQITIKNHSIEIRLKNHAA